MKLLIDENLSPLLARYAVEWLGYAAESVQVAGLEGQPDEVVFARAAARQQVVVTINRQDFLTLARTVAPHPGVIVIREAGLTRGEQWERLQAALEYLEDAGITDLGNQVLVVVGPEQLELLRIPADGL